MTAFSGVFLHRCGLFGRAAYAKLPRCLQTLSPPHLVCAVFACLLATSAATHAEVAQSNDVATEDAPVLVSVSQSTAAAVFRYRGSLRAIVVEDVFPNGDFRLVRVSNTAVLIERLSAAPGTPELTEIQLGQSVPPALPILRNNVYPLPAASGESQ